MTTVTRDEFETVKQLLASAARYAESANRSSDRTQQQLDQISAKVDRLIEAQSQTQQQLDQLGAQQATTQQQLDHLSLQVQRNVERVDAFVSSSQHYFTKHAESIEQLKGISERLEGLLAYVIRKEGRGE